MNKNEDRGMLKWQPFYSVLSEKEIKDLYNEKEETIIPELSDDQKQEIENIIIECYNNQKNVNAKIVNKNKIILVEGKITKLDPIHKAVYINKKMILFNNIIEVKQK